MSNNASKFYRRNRWVCLLKHPKVAGVIAPSEIQMRVVAEKVSNFPTYQTWRNSRDMNPGAA